MKSMKKFFSNRIFAFAMAMVMVCALAIQPMTAFAAEADTNDVQDRIAAAETAVEELAWSTTGSSVVQPRAHVSYYPYKGVSSGVFYGQSNTNPPTYSGLPGGKLYFSYSVSGGGTCYLIFHTGTSTSGTGFWSSALTADDIAHESFITLPNSGTYTVEVYVPNNSSERIFAFNLYTK